MDRPRGYTLLETATVVAIAGVLLGVGVPELSRSAAAARHTAAVNELLGALQYGRREAIKRNADVVLCGVDEHGRCLPANRPWHRGYAVFVDARPGRPYRPGGEADMLAVKAAPAALHLSANREAFVLRPLRLRTGNGTVRACSTHPRVAPRALIVSVTGRPRVARRSADGGPIPCPSP